MPPPTLMLLDTASLYFRAFFGVPDSMRSPDGKPVNAVRGLLDFIARLVTTTSRPSWSRCMDADWRPQFRVAAIPSYKAHRVAYPRLGRGGGARRPLSSVPVIEDVLDALGIARWASPATRPTTSSARGHDPGPSTS